MLQMSTNDLRKEIYKTVNLNPALEIVNDPKKDAGLGEADAWEEKGSWERGVSLSSGSAMEALEATADRRETLQQHLMHQLNATKLSPDEYDLCQKLIYNLDKNGCYGSMRAPETLLDKSRPLQTAAMLQRCLDRIQKMDPVGTCCRTLEESLFIQAKIAADASPLTLFILDGHLDFLNPPEPEKVHKKLRDFLNDWNKKSFAKKLPFDEKDINPQAISDSIRYILSLNPRPAAEFGWETSTNEAALPDIVLTVTRESAPIPADDFQNGKVALPHKDFHFQVKYASGVLPEIRLSPAAASTYDHQTVESAKQFLNNILFRQNTIALQGCAIVKNQLDFFEKGPGNLHPLTRKKIAQQLGIHESTVSRMSAKKDSKYIQTEFGLFPASYFFSSGLARSRPADGEGGINAGEATISAEAVKIKMSEILSAQKGEKLSDNALTKILNESGIQIARRTVAKYRSQLGLQNSYKRRLP